MSQAVATARVLLVDDNPNALRALQHVLERNGFDVDTARSGAEALERLSNESFQALITDLKMPEMSGMEILQRAHSEFPDLPVLILTAHGSVQSAVEAVRMGAWDYFLKPFQGDEVVLKLRQAVERRELSQEVKRLKARVYEKRGVEAIVGDSPALRKVLQGLTTVARKDVSVIIYGESGTGKELAARAIHQASPRADRPFVAVNCASIPETLLENELFGHVRGAYTGADSDQKGLFEEAHTGTIFLDEVGDIPMSIQAKLLRVLQEQEFKKIGGSRDIRVDVRVISATNRDLKTMVEAGGFREDVYYRLNVIPIRMPALRERVEDIHTLTHYFLKLFNDELNLQIKGFSEQAMDVLLAYDWPGNVRELKNKIKMAMVMASGSWIEPGDLGLQPSQASPTLKPFQQAREDFEREYIIRVLRLARGNVKQAAKLARRDRSTFYDLLNKHRIDADEFRV